MKHAGLRSFRHKAPSAFLALLCLVTSPFPLVSQEKNTDPAKTPATPTAEAADLITVPDGKPVHTKLTKDLSTANAKVGDDVELTVAETVRQNGLVILPKGTLLSAKLTWVQHAGRKSRDGNVSFSVEHAAFPGSEFAALRPAPPAAGGKNFRDGVKAVGAMAVYPELPPGFGLLLLTIGGPMVLFGKGHERTVYATQVTTLYVHGPLQLKREVVLQMQPPPYKGPSQVFYKNHAYTKEGQTDAAFFCGRKEIGKIVPNQVLELELNPGTYWLSTGKDGGEKLRLEVEPDHQYYVERDANGLFLKNFDDNPRLLEDYDPWWRILDLTSSSPEETEELLATPQANTAPQNNH